MIFACFGLVKGYCAGVLALAKGKAYKFPAMTDMSDIPSILKKARAKRDSIVRRLLAAGRGPTEIGKELGVTRQRAQQIIKRLGNGQG